MSKIMVVEDDASLREIYSIRITAEGYDVVSAGDGEEALAMAVREKPDLILSDVMMPKISGFDMLDILRSTPETHDIKVVMMTALSADDQRQRGERLGADRYLVKSQVGIEDVVNTIHEVLGDKEPLPESATAVAAAASAGPATPAEPATPNYSPVSTTPAPAPAESSPASTAPASTSAEPLPTPTASTSTPATPTPTVATESIDTPAAPIAPAPALVPQDNNVEPINPAQ